MSDAMLIKIFVYGCVAIYAVVAFVLIVSRTVRHNRRELWCHLCGGGDYAWTVTDGHVGTET